MTALDWDAIQHVFQAFRDTRATTDATAVARVEGVIDALYAARRARRRRLDCLHARYPVPADQHRVHVSSRTMRDVATLVAALYSTNGVAAAVNDDDPPPGVSASHAPRTRPVSPTTPSVDAGSCVYYNVPCVDGRHAAPTPPLAVVQFCAPLHDIMSYAPPTCRVDTAIAETVLRQHVQFGTKLPPRQATKDTEEEEEEEEECLAVAQSVALDERASEHYEQSIRRMIKTLVTSSSRNRVINADVFARLSTFDAMALVHVYDSYFDGLLRMMLLYVAHHRVAYAEYAETFYWPLVIAMLLGAGQPGDEVTVAMTLALDNNDTFPAVRLTSPTSVGRHRRVRLVEPSTRGFPWLTLYTVGADNYMIAMEVYFQNFCLAVHQYDLAPTPTIGGLLGERESAITATETTVRRSWATARITENVVIGSDDAKTCRYVNREDATPDHVAYLRTVANAVRARDDFELLKASVKRAFAPEAPPGLRDSLYTACGLPTHTALHAAYGSRLVGVHSPPLPPPCAPTTLDEAEQCLWQKARASVRNDGLIPTAPLVTKATRTLTRKRPRSVAIDATVPPRLPDDYIPLAQRLPKRMRRTIHDDGGDQIRKK